ncbi:MAG: C39 family peptidase [Candidatus Kerfeldbacteria bacterium]|nr:C39 family peptidase [Candidatus Kerfeldbacteria bacterium]
MTKGITLFIFGAAVGITAWVVYGDRVTPVATNEANTNISNTLVNAEAEKDDEPAVGGGAEEEEQEAAQNDKELPPSVLLDVPFTSQAPHADWSLPYKEACEEAAMLMLHLANKKVASISADDADQAIKDLVAYEVKIFGFYEDTTAEQTVEFAEKFYDESYSVIENPTLEDMKKKLAAGKPIAAPMAGQLLGNPYYTAPGPVFHYLVIRGYDDTTSEFITNDPGTRRGELYRYSYDTILNAMHDWPGSEEKMTTGAKVIIVSE